MREQARLRHAGGVGQTADRQPLEAEAARNLQRLVEDRRARLLALAELVHSPRKIVRTFASVNAPSPPVAPAGRDRPWFQALASDSVRCRSPCRPSAPACLRR